jgi:PAS domain S-box-containing protein
MTSKKGIALHKFKHIVDLANEGIWTLDANNITDYINERGAFILGYKPEEMIGRPATDFTFLETKEGFRKITIMNSQVEVERYEVQARRKDGSSVWVSLSTSPILDSDGRYDGAMTIFTDITERKRLEEAFKESETKYREIVETAQEGILVSDLDGIITFSNERMAQLIGYTIEELTGRSGLELVPELDLPKVMDKFQERQAGFKDTYEIWMQHRDGQLVCLLASGAPIHDSSGRHTGNLGMYIDITERKRAEEANRIWKERFEMAQRAAGVGIWDWDIETGRLEWTPEMFVLFGLDPITSKASFDTWNSSLHPNDREGANARIDQALREHRYLDNEYRVIRPDVEVIWINALGHGDYDDQDRPVRISGICIDITRRKRIEEELVRSNAELQQFAYVASHDLQEPLRMVMSYLALLKKNYGNELSPKAKEYLSIADDGANRMRQLVNDLLQYSRVETQGREFIRVDMNKVAEAVTNDLHVAISESRAEVIIDKLPTVLADESQMKQLLTNLISNGLKFRSTKPPQIEVSARCHGNEWIFAVEDNGIGIDAQYHNKLFKMFQRLQNRYEYPGTGIGLAISKKIVERHGGRIWVESESDQGSTFFFSLPADRSS